MYNHLPRAGFRAKLKIAICGFWLPYWSNMRSKNLILRLKIRFRRLLKQFPVWHRKVELFTGSQTTLYGLFTSVLASGLKQELDAHCKRSAGHIFLPSISIVAPDGHEVQLGGLHQPDNSSSLLALPGKHPKKIDKCFNSSCIPFRV